MKLNQRTFILIAGAVIVLLVGGVALASRMMSSTETIKTYETTVVQRGTLLATVSSTGAISPLREAQLAFSTTGSLNKLDVKAGDAVTSGQVLASLDTRELELQLAQADAGLVSAQARLDQLKNPNPADVAAAQASVTSADAALAQLRTPNTNDVIAAKADLDKAGAAVARAQADYDRVGGATNPFIATLPQALALQQATLDYQKAQALFNSHFSPSDSTVKQAQAALEQARANLARLTTPNPNDVKSMQATVDQARAASDLSKTRLDYALIKAPFDGVVTRVDADLGSTIPAGRATLAIADISEYRIKLNIDETDIAKIKEGQDVHIGLDAYPDANLTAKVAEVASTATTVQGVVNYIVTVTLKNSQQAPLKLGMTADANIVIANRPNVLMLSNRAIRAAGKQFFVTIQKGANETQEIEVKTGLANDVETEIVSGLTEGQTVIIPLVQKLPTGFGSPR